MPTQEDWIYLAATLDCEGTIGIIPNRRSFSPNIIVGNTDVRLIKWLAHTFGGNVFHSPPQKAGWKPQSRWMVRRKDDIWFILSNVTGLLKLKKSQAIGVLEFIAVRQPWGQADENARAAREVIYRRLRVLNQKGIELNA